MTYDIPGGIFRDLSVASTSIRSSKPLYRGSREALIAPRVNLGIFAVFAPDKLSDS
jgi:hypothetical protein